MGVICGGVGGGGGLLIPSVKRNINDAISAIQWGLSFLSLFSEPSHACIYFKLRWIWQAMVIFEQSMVARLCDK